MKRLFTSGDKYLRRCSWKDLAAIKICLLALGLLGGMTISEKHKPKVIPVAVAAFTVTYIPVMAKFFSVLVGEERTR